MPDNEARKALSDFEHLARYLSSPNRIPNQIPVERLRAFLTRAAEEEVLYEGDAKVIIAYDESGNAVVGNIFPRCIHPDLAVPRHTRDSVCVRVTEIKGEG